MSVGGGKLKIFLCHHLELEPLNVFEKGTHWIILHTFEIHFISIGIPTAPVFTFLVLLGGGELYILELRKV